jgi:NAD(P)-dependent dehydrogenase (short-subunit alcohol dehydrogenase family)
MSNRWSNLLLNKTIVVTGASSGIGRECAIQFSKEGANLILIGRNYEQLDITLNNLADGKHEIINCDLGNLSQIKCISDELFKCAPVHGLVHCAGVQKTVPLKSFDVLEFDKIFHINVSSGIELTRVVSSPKIFNKGGGSIIFMSSISGIKAEKGKLEYSVTKAAINSAIKTIALEISVKSIRVNAISPAMVKTPILESMFKELPEESVLGINKSHLLGIIDPIEIADLCVFLLSDLSKKITGENIIIDSGYSLA